MKYTTPSIEVVNFNSSDSPRIGMQWWYAYGTAVTEWNPAPASYPGPSNVILQSAVNEITPTSCNNVIVYQCNPENLPADAYWDGTTYWVTDDGKSC